MGGNVALVEAHALHQFEVHPEGLGLFHGDDTVLADLVDGLRDELADLGVSCGDTRDLGDLALGLGLPGQGLETADRGLHARLDPFAQAHRVGASRYVAQALVDHRPRQHCRGSRAVACYVIGLLGDLFDQLGTNLFKRVFELDLFGDRDTVVGDRGGSPLLFQHHVAALGPSVTRTASASWFIPFSRARRACSSKAISLGIGLLLLRWADRFLPVPVLR